jgi:hypothetical protein
VVSTSVTVWHGRVSELHELRMAIERNCSCAWAAKTCSAHCLLVDQRTLDRLLFVRRTVGFYVQGEHST